MKEESCSRTLNELEWCIPSTVIAFVGIASQSNSPNDYAKTLHLLCNGEPIRVPSRFFAASMITTFAMRTRLDWNHVEFLQGRIEFCMSQTISEYFNCPIDPFSGMTRSNGNPRTTAMRFEIESWIRELKMIA